MTDKTDDLANAWQEFKSHEKMKIGVNGLPKRIILTNVGGYGSLGLGDEFNRGSRSRKVRFPHNKGE